MITWSIVRIGLLAVVVILGVTIYYKRSGRSFPWGNLLIGSIALCLILGMGTCVNSCRTERAAAKAAAAKAAANPPRPTPAVIKVGKLPTVHNFSDHADGCVTLTITSWEFSCYPMGGRVTVFPPGQGEPFIDTPGVKTKTAYPPGTWRWCPKDPAATGIEVWQ